MDLILFDLLLVLIAFLYVGMTIIIPIQLKKRDKITKFQARKIVHLFAGLSVLTTPYFNWPWFAVFIAGTLTVVTLFSSKDSKVKKLKELYDSIGEEAESKVGFLEGPFHYCLSITFLITLFVLIDSTRLYFPIAGILIMIISDTLASIFGKKYGKHNINLKYTGTIRTLEGSLVFFVSAFILCFGTFFIFGYLPCDTQITLRLDLVFLYSIITSVLATLIELISPSTYDDLTVPISTTLIIWLLAYVPTLL
ncbi:MAG: diacylglycerol/polyprenol kinase family protein [Promethearchaeati archaeon]